MPETERFEDAAAEAADRCRREIPVWAAVGAALIGGLAVAVQTRINGALSLELGDGVLAAALSFGSGLALLLVLLALSPARRRDVAQYARDLRAGRFAWPLAIGGIGGAAIVHSIVTGGPRDWATNPLLYLGGAIGVCYIFAMAIMVKPLGVLLLAMSTVAGQVLGALAIDALMPAAGHALHPLTVIGGALTVVAIAVASARPPRWRAGAGAGAGAGRVARG